MNTACLPPPPLTVCRTAVPNVSQMSLLPSRLSPSMRAVPSTACPAKEQNHGRSFRCLSPHSHCPPLSTHQPPCLFRVFVPWITQEMAEEQAAKKARKEKAAAKVPRHK